MLFITNRQPRGSIRSRKGRKFVFDLNQNAPCNSVFYCSRNAKDDYTEIGRTDFMDRLKSSNAKQILFYIHGFNNLPEPAIFPNAETLQRLFDQKEPGLVEVVSIIWPCDNDFGIVKDYWDDQKAADASALSFARVFQFFLEWRDQHDPSDPCLKRINVLSHSMGNRVLRETLAKWDQYDLASGVPLLFRNIFMVAADIVNESLEAGKPGRLISQSSRNVSVYYASDDLALRASKISNLKNKIASRRLGHTGPEDMDSVQSNVYAIDCDDRNTAYDTPTGHTYFLDDKNGNAGEVFNHIYHSLSTGRVKVNDKHGRYHVIQ